MKKEIIERLFENGHISKEEVVVLSSHEDIQVLKDFGVWKNWKYDESILLDDKRIEEARK
jgi:hypothetical protein